MELLEQPPATRKAWHRITNADPDLRRGDCSVCGPDVRVARRSARDRGEWRCYPPGTDRKGEGSKLRQKYRLRKKKYGLTVAEVDALEERYRGRCAICHERPEGVSLHVDHCHTSGKVRALLCPPCNQGLGLFRDDPDRLVRAADYLREHGA